MPDPYISDEVGLNNASSRSQVDTQDDEWRLAATAVGPVDFFQNTIPAGPNNQSISADGYTLMTSANGSTVQVSLRDLTDADIVSSNSVGSVASGQPRLDNTSTLQGNAPRPASYYDASAQPRSKTNPPHLPHPPYLLFPCLPCSPPSLPHSSPKSDKSIRILWVIGGSGNISQINYDRAIVL